jgi:hypothetical protein
VLIGLQQGFRLPSLFRGRFSSAVPDLFSGAFIL